MITVTLYSRKDCHLCDQARQDLDALQMEHPHELVTIDVDSSSELQRAYGFEVPVVEVGPYKLRAPFDRRELGMTLGAARDRRVQLHELQGERFIEHEQRGRVWTKADGFTYWLGKHYLAVFNLLVLIYMGLPVLAPMLMKAGYTAPAGLIYRGYGMVCHQLAFRSFFCLVNRQHILVQLLVWKTCAPSGAPPASAKTSQPIIFMLPGNLWGMIRWATR